MSQRCALLSDMELLGGGGAPSRMTRVLSVSRDELEARRTRILRNLHVTCSELAERARSSSLVAGEWEAWEELKDIAFLLGDVSAT